MKKFSLELPKYRLAVHFRFIKRRKPLVPEPVIPTVSLISKKYRKGTFLGKTIRHITGHQSARKIMAANFAFFAVAGSILPLSQVSNVNAADSLNLPDQVIIETQNVLGTQKGTQFPLSKININQGYNFFHPGVDFGAEVGDPVKPIKMGEVIEAGYTTGGYGNTIVLNHGKGLTSRYAHLSKIEVKIGQNINTDVEMGTVGLTGRTTGPHLHLEVRQNGIPLNPLSIIPK